MNKTDFFFYFVYIRIVRHVLCTFRFVHEIDVMYELQTEKEKNVELYPNLNDVKCWNRIDEKAKEKKSEDVGEGKEKEKTKKLNYSISDSVSIGRTFMLNNEHIHCRCM